VIGVGVALPCSIAAFGFHPHYPFWATVIVALTIAAIRAFTLHGRDIA